jgi:hypothetical protein
MTQKSYSKDGYIRDAFTVVSFEKEGKVLYKGVWDMRPCCSKGHKTVKAAADHAARINRDRALVAWGIEVDSVE